MMILWMFIGMMAAGMAAYKQRYLTKSGAFAAVFVGLAVYIGFDIKGLVLLGSFFVSSSLWSKYKAVVKQSIEEKLAKGTTRDWRQVMANGGAAALFSLIYSFQQDPSWLIGFIVCLASANSDTWASEIGSLSKRNPIYIRTFKRIEKGTSGAVSFLGSTAALAGAFLIALLSYWLFELSITLSLFVCLFGFLGNLFDTLMGAFYQQVYVCQKCGITTEKRTHCHMETTRIKGFTYVDNDMVNFLSGVMAAGLAMLINFN